MTYNVSSGTLSLYTTTTAICSLYLTVAVRVAAEAGNAAMYAGLAVAVLIFLIVIIFIICLLRRRVPRFIGQFSHLLTYFTNLLTVGYMPCF